jgi:hypothetical protein
LKRIELGGVRWGSQTNPKASSKVALFVWTTALGKKETHYSGGLVVTELKPIMLKSLYVWMIAYNYSHFCNS